MLQLERVGPILFIAAPREIDAHLSLSALRIQLLSDTYTCAPRGCITSISPVENSALSLSSRNSLLPRPPTKNMAFGFFCLLFIVSFLCLHASLRISLMTGSKMPLMSSLPCRVSDLMCQQSPRTTYERNRITSPVSCLLPFPFLNTFL
jgi:hypothetical protein